eukprot:UN08274
MKTNQDNPWPSHVFDSITTINTNNENDNQTIQIGIEPQNGDGQENIHQQIAKFTDAVGWTVGKATSSSNTSQFPSQDVKRPIRYSSYHHNLL